MIRVGGGEDDLRPPHPFGSAGAAQPLRDLKPAEPGHADVEEDQVIGQGVQQQERLFTIGGFSHHLDAADLLEQEPEFLAGRSLVVHDQSAWMHPLSIGGTSRPL